MKEPLKDYIEKNRESLDTYTPDQSAWNNIEKKIGKQKSGRKLIIYLSSAAALILIFLAVRKTLDFEKNNEIVQIEAKPVMDSIELKMNGISYQSPEQLGWSSQQEVHQKTLTNHQNRSYNLNNNNKSYTWQYGDGNATLDVAANGTYNVEVQDISSCYMSSNYNQPKNGGFQSNINCGLAEVDPNHDVSYYYEQYNAFTENEFETPLNQPLSTFGIDVDGAAYSNVRRFINDNFIPPKDAVKLEELINYFNYNLPEPTSKHPFSITTEIGACPWEKDHLLMQVALRGKSIDMDRNQANNLVFLIDVSGSMNDHNKLPLLKKSLKLLVNEMNDDDQISIVVYAGAAGLVLTPTSCKDKAYIYQAIENLSAGGSTAGGEGIKLAYKVAEEALFKKGNNRIILATDGDFNVGISDDQALVRLIEEKRKSGISLSVLGFGMGNYQDGKMEKLADNGNGNHYYIDNLLEAKKVLVNEIGGTLITIAKDVKLQLEFNPEHVKSYRLLGYENRILSEEDFDDDTKDAGDLGSGHTIVAFYEIIPQNGSGFEQPGRLRYQKNIVDRSKGLKDELASIKFRYKKPDANTSQLISKIITYQLPESNSSDFQFATAVAEFGLLIRESKYKGNASFNRLIERAIKCKGKDVHGYRAEFIQLAEKAQLLMSEYYSKHYMKK